MTTVLHNFAHKFEIALGESGYTKNNKAGNSYASFGLNHGVHPTSVASYIRGETVPRMSSLMKICNGLGVEVSYFTGDKVTTAKKQAAKNAKKIGDAVRSKRKVTKHEVSTKGSEFLLIDSSTGDTTPCEIQSKNGRVIVLTIV
jgi:hypothetical protein